MSSCHVTCDSFYLTLTQLKSHQFRKTAIWIHYTLVSCFKLSWSMIIIFTIVMHFVCPTCETRPPGCSLWGCSTNPDPCCIFEFFFVCFCFFIFCIFFVRHIQIPVQQGENGQWWWLWMAVILVIESRLLLNDENLGGGLNNGFCDLDNNLSWGIWEKEYPGINLRLLWLKT